MTYLLLTFIYQFYLQQYEANQVDGITNQVAQNSKHLLQVFTQNSETKIMPSEGYIKLFYNQKYVARVIEGCNAMSIVILFVAFVVAFSGKIKTTLLFILGGSIAIYILNVVRIAILCMLLYSFPEQEIFLHRVFFPLFIYGFVFLMWVIWVAKFSLYAKDTNPKQD